MKLFRNLHNWWHDVRDWHRVHREVWPPVIVLDSEGFTPFQHMALSSLESAFGPLDLHLATDLGNYLSGPLADTGAIVWIYEDGAQISQNGKDVFWAEHNSYRDPQELINALMHAATQLQSNNSFKPNPHQGGA